MFITSCKHTPAVCDVLDGPSKIIGMQEKYVKCMYVEHVHVLITKIEVWPLKWLR